MSTWVVVNQDIFTGVVPTSFTPFDVSSFVGPNHCLLRLGIIINSGSGSARYKTRPTGRTDSLMAGDSSAHGFSYVFASISNWVGITALTGPTGVMDHSIGFTGGVNITVRLLGYCILTEDSPVKIQTSFDLDGAGWIIEDVSSEMNGNDGLAFFTYRSNGFGGGVLQGVRAMSDSYDWLTRNTSLADNLPLPGGDHEAVQIEGVNGLYRHAMVASSSPLLEIWFEGGIATPDVTLVNQVVDPDFIPASLVWTDLDLSAFIPGNSFFRIRVEHGLSGDPGDQAVIALRPKGETRDFAAAPGSKSVSTASVTVTNDQPTIIHGETNGAGIVEVWNSVAFGFEAGIKVTLVDFIQSVTPPVFTNKLPIGGAEKPGVAISFTVSDDTDVNTDTLNVDLVGPGPVTLNAIINGDFQGGFGGVITDNMDGSYDVTIPEHPLLAEGAWTVEAEADDDTGATGADSWAFTTLWKPDLVAVRAVGRRLVELEVDVPIVVRDIVTRTVEPADRYVPVDWIAHGGNVLDAANPANFVLARPSGGELDGPGEAAPILSTFVDEVESYGEDSGAIRRSTHVRVRTDYQMTARAGYRITISNLESETGQVLGQQVVDFTGFIVSHVERGSLHLWDLVSGIHRRDDREGTGDLAKLFVALQEVLDRLLEDVDSFFLELVDIDKLREEFLDTLLHDLGNPFEGMFALSATKKRRLAAILVQIYREKGTCQGILNAVLFFVEVALTTCFEPWAGAWRLAGGSYPAPTGPDQDELGIDTVLGAGTEELYTFRVVSPIVLTADQRDQINAIADYMKPANTIYKGIIEP